MGAIPSQITSLTIVYSIVYSDADQRKHQSSASLAFVWGIHWSPVNSPHKWPVTRKMFPFDEVIMLEVIAWESEHPLLWCIIYTHHQASMLSYMDELMQERRNASALAIELRLYCINSSISLLIKSWHRCRLFSRTLKTKICHDANSDVINSGFKGCHNDNLWCHQWNKVCFKCILITALDDTFLAHIGDLWGVLWL